MKILLLGLLLLACVRNVWPDEKYLKINIIDYKIGSEDNLQITVWGNANLNTKAVVRSDGFITLPLINDIKATDTTPSELRKEIERRLESYIKKPVVNVTVTSINSYRVYVIGQATSPGEFKPKNFITVLQALAMAKGLTQFADKSNIMIVRKTDKGFIHIPFNLSQVMKGKRLIQNITLQTGDTVVVP